MTSEIDRYDYEHPLASIAQEPPEARDGGRLLHVVRHDGGPPVDRLALDLPQLLKPGDLLVLNEVRVMPARLVAYRSTGGRVSVLVLEAEGARATVLLGARGRCLPGEILDVGGFRWRIVESQGGGHFVVESVGGEEVLSLVGEQGRMPLPPYIRREPERDARDAADRERYQTVFARGERATAVAAPTAGLHFTPELLAAVEQRGVRRATIRLDVGEGTFRPVRAERLDDHEMHVETYHVPEQTARAWRETREAGGRVVAVGTTVVRTLESAVSSDGLSLSPGPGSTQLFLREGHRFQAVDALLTNFHQPRSTLLVLVSAFGGHGPVMRAYQHAVAAGYRLFSYGDAMFLDQSSAIECRP